MKTGAWKTACRAGVLAGAAMLTACGGGNLVIGVVNTTEQSVGVTIEPTAGGLADYEVAGGSSLSLSKKRLSDKGVQNLADGVTITVRPEAGRPMAIRMEPPAPYHLRVTGANGRIGLVRDQPQEVDPLGGANPEYDPRRDNPGFGSSGRP